MTTPQIDRRYRRRHDGQRHRAGMCARRCFSPDARRGRTARRARARSHRHGPGAAGQEGKALPRRARCCARPPARRDGLRRARRLRLRHRSRHRGRGAEGKDPAPGGRAREGRRHRRHQHLVDLDYQARRRLEAPGALRRPALLQPGAAHGAGRGGARPADRRCDRRGGRRAREAPRQDAGRGEGLSGVRRQPAALPDAERGGARLWRRHRLRARTSTRR